MRLTTTRLTLPSPRALWNLPVPVATTMIIFCLMAIAGLVGRIKETPSAAVAIPTPALPVIIIATSAPAPTAAPVQQVAAVLPNALRGAVVAYDSPNGSVLGAIEAGRPYQLLARYGAEWLQADVAGSGVVWLKADQVLNLPEGLADLQPPPAPVVVERPIYIAAQQPAHAAAPTVSEPSEPPPTVAPQMQAVWDRQQWALDAQRAGR
jgi:hypothetical protein